MRISEKNFSNLYKLVKQKFALGQWSEISSRKSAKRAPVELCRTTKDRIDKLICNKVIGASLYRGVYLNFDKNRLQFRKIQLLHFLN